MKHHFSAVIIATFSLFAVTLPYQTMAATETHNHTNHTATYVCPMHPEVTSHQPGSCPKCGMFLVEVPQQPADKHAVSEDSDKDHPVMHTHAEHSTSKSHDSTADEVFN